uniref:tRNA (guanine(26)-N(2))-dimethyltransferase n=1 Tax=Heterorhabditis bacteriophora TaxID=37862 RepID=A0A1I7XNI2_HETBA
MTMMEHRNIDKRFHAVDLDPYGSASVFLDSAVQCVSDKGILMVTCTDMAVLCGNTPEACYNKYDAITVRLKCCHEMALRILLRSIDSHANRYTRYIEPLLAISIDFYVRVFVRVHTGARNAKDSGTKIGTVLVCSGCHSMEVLPLLRKTEEGSSVKYSPCVIRQSIMGSHCNPRALKTNAPVELLWDICRTVAMNTNVSTERFNENAPGRKILEHKVKNTINFNLHPEASLQTKNEQMVRFQCNKCDVKCQNESNQIMKEKLTSFLAPRFSVEAEDPIKSLLLLNELSWENTDIESNISRTTLYTIDCDFGSEKIKRDAKLTNVSTATTDNRCNITTAVSAFIATNTSDTITTTTSTNTTIDIVTTAKERTGYDNTSILVELDEWTSIPMDELEEFWLYLCPVIEEVELEKTAQLSYIKCDTKNVSHQLTQ